VEVVHNRGSRSLYIRARLGVLAQHSTRQVAEQPEMVDSGLSGLLHLREMIIVEGSRPVVESRHHVTQGAMGDRQPAGLRDELRPRAQAMDHRGDDAIRRVP
jgi:hypothetical protein